MDALIADYISEQMKSLTQRNSCCINCFGPFFRLEHALSRIIAGYGLKNKIHIISGHKVLKFYKPSCNHNVQQPSSFQLTTQSQRDILYHLKKIDGDIFNQDMLISPQIFRPTRQKPVIPPNRFTIGPHRQTIYQTNALNKQSVQETWKINQFRDEIMKNVKKNRILVVNGDVSLDKSTAVPMFIVEDATARGQYCKILCVEADNLSAITHCTMLTKHMKERIGSRVGFQVYLQSRVCDNTNLIYTTAVFFLRVLMGQNTNESFRHISHIVISNVHLHHAYTDILLHELKKVLPHYPQIKIILLSDSFQNTKLLSYFGEGRELRLTSNLNNVKIHYIEEINKMLHHKLNPKKINDILPKVTFNKNVNKEWIDKALEEYEQTGSDTALNRFLYFVNDENVSVNYTHSKLGYSAIIIAAKHGKSGHLLRLLAYENANPYQQDMNKFSALEYAISNDDINCARVLLKFFEVNVRDQRPPPVDFELIKQLIHTITTSWKFGHILVFLPTYEDLLKLSYSILKMQFIGRVPQDLIVYLLHPNMQFDQLQPIIAESASVKVILSTNLAESLTYLNDITYIIDSSLNCLERYHPDSKSKESTIEWTSKESLQRRAAIASRHIAGHCFRLIPKALCSKLNPLSPPELAYMTLNRIALTVKLLSPHSSVSEYLQNTIVQPSTVHVNHSVGFLKKIEVFDCMEDVTWLGCRLIDVPMDLELGKSLVLSILLKCLDPVLTIVSFLTCTDAREITKCKSSIASASGLHKNEKTFVQPDNSWSDHLILLRLYQVWQNDKRENTLSDTLSDEDTYVINGILDKVCIVRTYLVGALRSSQLIHNQGQLSMHSINSKANNWAVIKAALAGGLYPKLCMIDRGDERLKSYSRELSIHPSSTLRSSKNGVVSAIHQTQPSDWIVYFGEARMDTVNCISNCTLVSPVTIALFAGKTELDPANLFFPKPLEQNVSSETCGYAALFLDEWTLLATDINSALMVYTVRQKFYSAYMDFLQSCGNSEKWRKSSTPANEIHRVFDVISKVLLEEDVTSGFVQPNRVGNRPKAMANKFTSDFDQSIHPRPVAPRRKVDCLLSSLNSYRCLEKEFFLINVFDSHELMKSFWKLSTLDISSDSFFDPVCTSATLQKLTYVIVNSLNRKRLTNVAVVKCDNGGFFLRNCFQLNVSVYDIM